MKLSRFLTQICLYIFRFWVRNLCGLNIIFPSQQSPIESGKIGPPRLWSGETRHLYIISQWPVSGCKPGRMSQNHNYRAWQMRCPKYSSYGYKALAAWPFPFWYHHPVDNEFDIPSPDFFSTFQPCRIACSAYMTLSHWNTFLSEASASFGKGHWKRKSPTFVIVLRGFVW